MELEASNASAACAGAGQHRKHRAVFGKSYKKG